MTAYIETPSDVAFTRFIKSCETRTVVAERGMPVVEKKRRGRPKQQPAAKPRFTDRQIEIAVAALAYRTRKTNAADAAEKSN